jgi:hypothetical protein
VVQKLGLVNRGGKTTFAREFLPNYADCKNFINADLIAQGVSPFSPETVAFRAGRLMLEEIDLYAKPGDSFGFETTLSGRSYLSLIRRLKRRGYEVHFFYLWVPSVELALLFPEIKNRSLCTDPACHHAKVQAFVQLRVGPLAKEGKQPVQISESPSWQVLSRAPNTFYEGQYRRAETEGECPHTQVAVVVDGRKAGTVIHVCTDEKCKTHRQFSHYEISPQEREQRRKLALAVRVQKEARSRILQAVRQKLPAALARADFEMVALDYFRRLGHDNHHRLFQVYGWEETKTKTSWGGNTVNHEKLAEARIHAMTAADLNRFMETCALVPDLYCPGYSSAETLSKEANLLRAAIRYKVDASKITTQVSADLSARRSATRRTARLAPSGGTHQTAKAR